MLFLKEYFLIRSQLQISTKSLYANWIHLKYAEDYWAEEKSKSIGEWLYVEEIVRVNIEGPLRLSFTSKENIRSPFVNITSHSQKSRRWQFHQHFTRNFLYESFLQSFFCSNVLKLYFFSPRILSEKLLTKCWWIWLKIGFYFGFRTAALPPL